MSVPPCHNATLVRALKRIAEHEIRAHRAGRRLVDVSEIEALQRIARVALRFIQRAA